MNDKQVSDTWKRGDPYEQYVGRWSRRVAPSGPVLNFVPEQLIARTWAIRASAPKPMNG